MLVDLVSCRASGLFSASADWWNWWTDYKDIFCTRLVKRCTVPLFWHMVMDTYTEYLISMYFYTLQVSSFTQLLRISPELMFLIFIDHNISHPSHHIPGSSAYSSECLVTTYGRGRYPSGSHVIAGLTKLLIPSSTTHLDKQSLIYSCDAQSNSSSSNSLRENNSPSSKSYLLPCPW